MTTWSPSDKSSNVLLSNGDLTATQGPSGGSFGVRSTDSQTSGSKFYCEVTWNSPAGGANTCCGFTTASANLGTVGFGAAGALVYSSSGDIWFNGAGPAASLGTLAGAVVSMAVDLVNSRAWFRKNGGNWNNSGTANPATNTGGINIAAMFPTNAAFLVGSFSSVGVAQTANFGVTAFAYAIPSGFSAWTSGSIAPPASNTAVTINTG